VVLPHPATQANAVTATTLMANRCTEFILISPLDFGCRLALGLSNPPIVTLNTRLLAAALSIRDSR
jgi:hypothetical protein